jgi:hypothetical protein
MASPPIPPPFDDLANRPFSFYPPILNVEHNEWLYRKATWPEILVVNRKTGTEIWIPRRFLGEVSRIDDPVLIVGLNRELEYKGGAVWPYQRRVLQMPVAVGAPSAAGPQAAPERSGPAPVVGIRLESRTDRRIFKRIGGAVAVSVMLYVAAINLNLLRVPRQRNAGFAYRDRSFLALTGQDDWAGVLAKLGPPASDRWQSEIGAIQYRALSYPDRNYTVILMGSQRAGARYIGTVDDRWKPIHSALLPGGGSTDSLLRALKRF